VLAYMGLTDSAMGLACAPKIGHFTSNLGLHVVGVKQAFMGTRPRDSKSRAGGPDWVVSRRQ
jgi:hypothetical protein